MKIKKTIYLITKIWGVNIKDFNKINFKIAHNALKTLTDDINNILKLV